MAAIAAAALASPAHNGVNKHENRTACSRSFQKAKSAVSSSETSRTCDRSATHLIGEGMMRTLNGAMDESTPHNSSAREARE